MTEIELKKYYKIGEIAVIIGEPVSTCQFWIRSIGKLKTRDRYSNGDLMFDKSYLDLFFKIKHMRWLGLCMKSIDKYIKEGTETLNLNP